MQDGDQNKKCSARHGGTRAKMSVEEARLQTMDAFNNNDNTVCNTQAFQTFWNSCLHGGRWPKGVHAFYVTDQGDVSPVFQNGRGQDAEDHVISSVRQLCLRHHPFSRIRITVFQSLSPCENCCQSYTRLLKEARDLDIYLELTIVVSGLYKIRRPSCLARACRHRLPGQQDHDSQSEHLRQLVQSGICLRSFEYADWRRFLSCLGLPSMSEVAYERNKRSDEDLALKSDLQEVLEEPMKSFWTEGVGISTGRYNTRLEALIGSLVLNDQRPDARRCH